MRSAYWQARLSQVHRLAYDLAAASSPAIEAYYDFPSLPAVHIVDLGPCSPRPAPPGQL